ncbi:unnamed protein product [Ectocarpus sp. CCAP 1310/34]|nr:unnamed protein product [Ectocarpus sp. CCAP 1310/34]
MQSDLDEDVFMRLPEGCGRLSGLVVKLWKSLYGLKQASRHWHAHLTRCLLLLRFLQCMADACVFRLMDEGRVIMIIVVHVDDIFAVGQKERCDKFGRDLNEMVPVKNLGVLRWYSACFYERDVERGLLRISQQRVADVLAAKYGIEWGRSVPLPVSVKLTDFDENEACADVPFREMVGSLMWLATQTRQDIANGVRAVVARGVVTGTSMQVWRFLVPHAGTSCIPVFEDNQGTIQIANNPITNSNSKHIDVRHHFIRELVERKEISITHVPTQFQHADFLKAISKESLALHRDFVMKLQ